MATAYAGGFAQSQGGGGASADTTADVLQLSALSFDPILRTGLDGGQRLEPDLVAARAAIERADHVAWVFPVWWGSMPALLKGFVDRTFLPGWAFNARPSGRPEGLLAGRTARVLLTMDAPRWFDRWFYGASARRSMERATLWYTGFERLQTRVFSEVLHRDQAQREQWLAQARADGEHAAADARKRQSKQALAAA